ncbi:MAG TPA: primosomal protein N' [Vicinamibacterales bacterium]|nr:primosomal protein N' [Vicinamibacterales bacterium]
MVRFASVAVPLPQVDLLTYRVPESLETPAIGARVLVPVGSRILTGCVAALHEEAGEIGRDGGPTVRDLIDVLDGDAYVPGRILDLAAWVAEYYACGPGEAVAAAVPRSAWIESRQFVRATDEGRRALSGDAGVPLGEPARRLIAAAAAAGGLPASALRARLDRKPAERGVGRFPLASVLRTLGRAGLVTVSQVLEGSRDPSKTERVLELTAAGREAATAQAGAKPTAFRLGPRQQALIGALRDAGAPMSAASLRQAGFDLGGLHRSGLRGLVAVRHVRAERDPFAGAWGRAGRRQAEAPPVDLTAEQAAAVDRLGARVDAAAFHVALLHGVTGSGKTEIYVRLAARADAAGRRAIVLVPEIALTPGTAAVFRARFGDRVAIQHSGLSDGERHDQWQRTRRGEIAVVVGTRSAVFAPLADVGLIVVDEEHDASYKQDETPRYNGRDVAVVRGRRESALVVLGSATPSMESYAHAKRGRYELVSLERRVLERPLAAVRTVDMRREYAEAGPETVISRALASAMADTLARGEQVLLLLNRRGYSTSVFCRQCGAALECPSCSVSLVVHGRGQAVCHYCNHSRRVPKACPACGGPFLEQAGCGTERVEAETRALAPEARVARLDRDTARRRGAAASLLSRFADGDIDVLVGTQMIAKGHDFPRVTLVGVISADVGLGLADFRAAERTFQLLTQVVGRAGRGDAPGEAIVQTLCPEHYSIRLACRQEYAAFFDAEMAFRRAMRYPPVVALVNGVVRGPTQAAAMQAAGAIVAAIRERGTERQFTVLGPAPAPLARLRGRHRAQFFLKGPAASRAAMRQAVLAALRARPDLRRHVTIDVDPASVL